MLSINIIGNEHDDTKVPLKLLLTYINEFQIFVMFFQIILQLM